MTDIVPAPAPVRLPVLTGGRESGEYFPVREVYCVGRNYAAHAREMGHDPDRDPPFFFRKDREHLLVGGGALPYPPGTQDLHHEVELVVALGAGGSDLSPEEGAAAVIGHAVGIDLTRRDLQAQAKAMGRPWDLAKGFAGAAPIGPLVLREEVSLPPAAWLSLSVDGEARQSGQLNQMIWPIGETIAYLSGLVDLYPGDLIFTGTPAGVGPVTTGSRMRARIDGLPDLDVDIVAG